jgi:hypothetical protein
MEISLIKLMVQIKTNFTFIVYFKLLPFLFNNARQILIVDAEEKTEVV